MTSVSKRIDLMVGDVLILGPLGLEAKVTGITRTSVQMECGGKSKRIGGVIIERGERNRSVNGIVYLADVGLTNNGSNVQRTVTHMSLSLPNEEYRFLAMRGDREIRPY